MTVNREERERERELRESTCVYAMGMMMKKTRSGVAVMLLVGLVVLVLAMMVSSAQGKTDDAAGGEAAAESDVIALTDLTFDGAIASSKMYFVKVCMEEDVIHDS